MIKFLVFLVWCIAHGGGSEVTLNTGYKIPLIGLGTYLIKEKSVIDNALNAGYRLFDTAHVYKNEKELGKAFEELLPKYGLTRNDIFITTKIIPTVDYKTEADYEKLIRESLTNLKTDYIDLFLLHFAGVHGLPDNSTQIPSYRRVAWNAFTKFQKQGLIRSVGVSNYLIRHLKDLKSFSNVVPALNQVEWHPKSHDDALLKYCKDNGILLQAYSSLGSSFNSSLRHDPIVGGIAQRLRKSPSQVLLRWATQNDIAIIPKASSKKHLDENINLNFTIPAADMTTLSNFGQDERVFWNPNNIIYRK